MSPRSKQPAPSTSPRLTRYCPLHLIAGHAFGQALFGVGETGRRIYESRRFKACVYRRYEAPDDIEAEMDSVGSDGYAVVYEGGPDVPIFLCCVDAFEDARHLADVLDVEWLDGWRG